MQSLLFVFVIHGVCLSICLSLYNESSQGAFALEDCLLRIPGKGFWVFLSYEALYYW